MSVYSIDVDTIPLKLIKLSAEILAKPLKLAINCSLNQVVISLDKGKPKSTTF